jgi:hypothetical protein
VPSNPRLAACCAVAALSFSAADARAYCRTTTCDPREDANGCARDANSCETRGQSLFWPDACVTYAVQRNGSPLRGISAYETDQAARKAFSAWLGADCPGGGHPSIGVIPLGGASCDEVEFNPPKDGRAGAPNANIVMYRDDDWPYPDEFSVIARTSLTFDPATGAIFDADIEINSFENEFSLSDTAISNDLQAVLTHEIGHFLGLDHSSDPYATMRWNYSLSSLSARTLSSDDKAGICSIYAPDPNRALTCPGDTGPHNGFSRECGADPVPDASCASLAPGSPAELAPGLGCWAALAALVLARRRARCGR